MASCLESDFPSYSSSLIDFSGFTRLAPLGIANHVEEGCHCTVAIVGGGFTGSMLAVQLLHIASYIVSVVVIERRPVPGPGLAYGAQFEGNLLIVRAKNMSIYRRSEPFCKMGSA